MANAFYQFDKGKQNILKTSTYAGRIELTNGVQTGVADSQLHNKLFYQVSTITSALAEVIDKCGWDMGPTTEEDWNKVVKSISNLAVYKTISSSNVLTMQMGENKANYEIYTKAGIEGYITGLNLATQDWANATFAFKGEGGSGSGGITIHNVKSVIDNAFSAPGTNTIVPATGGLQFTSQQATETEVRNGTSNRYISASILKSCNWVPVIEPNIDSYLIYSSGGKWIKKAWSDLSSGFLTTNTQNLQYYYTKNTIDSMLDAYAKKNDVYDKTTSDNKYATQQGVANALQNYYTQNDANNKFVAKDQFTGTNQNLNLNGYQKLPGGLIIHWGSIDVGIVGNEVYSSSSFANGFSFPTNCFMVLIGSTTSTSSGSESIGFRVTSWSKTGFGWYSASNRRTPTQDGNITYLAIGN
jgi:hypothetical protein